MNREDVLKVCRALVETRITRTPRIVGTAALVLHNVVETCDDLNILLNAQEFAMLTSSYTSVPHPDHKSGTIITQILGHPVTFAHGGIEHFKLVTVCSEGVNFPVSYPSLVDLLHRYEKKQVDNPRESFAARINLLRATLDRITASNA